jgi:hypothetical protein
MDLATAIRNIQPKRKAILFLGAGFSNVAKNELGMSTPAGSQLADRILKRLNILGTANLGLAVDKLREKLSPADAFEFIRSQLTVTALSDEQQSILSLPWTRIYTTNVDNIASELAHRTWRDAASDEAPVTTGDVVCLHGCITNCTPTNYYQKLKLGEQLYLMGPHGGSGYYHMFNQDLYECDVVFIVGYSMADPDLATIFFGSDALINKCFVFSGTADELSAHRISLIGTNTNSGLVDLARMVRARPSDEALPVRAELSIDTGAFESKEITQTARQNLLIFGRYDVNVARSNWALGGPAYVVKREIGEQLASLKPPIIAIVHSHLGNGKSLIFEYAKFLMTRTGSEVFTIRSDILPESLPDILREIPPGSRVFFEGDIFATGDAATVVRDRSLVLCVSARTTTVRVAMPGIVRTSADMLRVFPANHLTHPEVENFHDLIDGMAFWPAELSQKSRQVRLQRLEHEFNSNINAIILNIFENQKVKAQIVAPWKAALEGLRPVLDHFIVASYMQMIDISVPSYILNEFQHLDYRALRELGSDIVRVSFSGNISFGNAIIGEFVLRNHPKKNDIIGAVVRFANFIAGHSSQRSLQWIVRRVLRYRNLSRLLGSSTLPNEVFDRASHIPAVSGDPLFWVQYSISQMENNNFLPADRYLSTAYARAEIRGPNFDTYQIDTHAARLIVRKIATQGVYDVALRDILDATKKLRAVVQRRPDDLYHVASVVVQMLKGDVRWEQILNENEYVIFKRDLSIIGNALRTIPAGELLFATEREALDLINKRFG